MYPSWFPPTLEKLVEREIPVDLAPTLLIGVGPTGCDTLRYVKQAVLDRCRGKEPDTVKFLWVGLQSETELRPEMTPLSSKEKVILRPDYARIRSVLSNNQAFSDHYRWWKAAHTSDRVSRADARMALHYLFDFENNLSLIKTPLENALNTLIRPPRYQFHVFFAASADEPEAGMLIDLVYLVRSVINNQIDRCTLWLSLNSGRGLGDAAAANRQAMCRELARFSSGMPQKIDLGFQMERKVSDPHLFDNIFALDIPESSLAVADMWRVFLEPNLSLEVTSRLQQVQTNQTLLSNLFTVTAPGYFTYLFPAQQIRAVCSARLVNEVLFGNGVQIPRRGLLSPTGAPQTPDVYQQKLAEFLASEDLFGAALPAAQALLDVIQRRPLPAAVQIPPDFVLTFRKALLSFLNREMNNPAHISHRLGALGWAEEFLKTLASAFNELPARLVLQKAQKKPAALELEQKLPQLKAVLSGYYDQVNRWKAEISNTLMPRVQELLKTNLEDLRFSMEGPVGPPPTRSQQEAPLFAAFLAPQETPAAPSPRRRALLMENNATLPELRQDPAYPYYRDFVAMQHDDPHWSALLGRFGWRWEDIANTQPELYFLAFGPQVGKEDWRQALCSLTEEGRERMWKGLCDLGSYYTRKILDECGIEQELKKLNNERFVEPLRKVSPLLKHVALGVQAPPTYLLAGKDEDQRLRRILADQQLDLGPVVKSEDPYRLSLLVFDTNIPLEKTDLLAARPAQGTGTGLDAYVYQEEQAAVQVERQLGSVRLDPRLISLMHDPAALKTLMWCVFYGWLENSRREDMRFHWAIGPDPRVGLPELRIEADDLPNADRLETALSLALVTIPSKSHDTGSPWVAAQKRFERTIAQLNICIEKASRLSVADRSVIRQRAEENISRWQVSSSKFEISLASYQQLILAEYDRQQSNF